ncbi:MAG: hypothetical protein C0623_13615 [Desulfuromonas sp.]|nr:MAG: hypothetical protein C0623_13615 [Desulfuromonas sp.]
MKHINKLNESKTKYGVGEWAQYSYNIGTGCTNNCRYCYARDLAVEINQRTDETYTRESWRTEQVKTWKVDIDQTAKGTIMFPTMHDISEAYLETYIETLDNLLAANNEVLIVTKPRLNCIQQICDKFQDYRNKILIRMTITSLDENLSQFWEQDAPLPEERIQALQYAHEQGYKTSVSVEPMIDTVGRTIELYNRLEPYITEDIWFGKMNSIKYRVDASDKQTRDAVKAIYDNQTDRNIMKLYNELKDLPKVQWKDSIQSVVKRAS